MLLTDLGSDHACVGDRLQGGGAVWHHGGTRGYLGEGFLLILDCEYGGS
jgi:hypothetical protein